MLGARLYYDATERVVGDEGGLEALGEQLPR